MEQEQHQDEEEGQTMSLFHRAAAHLQCDESSDMRIWMDLIEQQEAREDPLGPVVVEEFRDEDAEQPSLQSKQQLRRSSSMTSLSPSTSLQLHQRSQSMLPSIKRALMLKRIPSKQVQPINNSINNNNNNAHDDEGREQQEPENIDHSETDTDVLSAREESTQQQQFPRHVRATLPTSPMFSALNQRIQRKQGRFRQQNGNENNNNSRNSDESQDSDDPMNVPGAYRMQGPTAGSQGGFTSELIESIVNQAMLTSNSNQRNDDSDIDDEEELSSLKGFSRNRPRCITLMFAALIVVILVILVPLGIHFHQVAKSSSEQARNGNIQNWQDWLKQCQQDSNSSLGSDDIPPVVQKHLIMIQDRLRMSLSEESATTKGNCGSRDSVVLLAMAFALSSENISPVLEGKNNTELIQRFALTHLFVATHGIPLWTSTDRWLTAHETCTWYGVECNMDAILIRLDLSENGLHGSVPSIVFESLKQLEILDLHKNSITSENMLESIAAFQSNLRYLDLSGAQGKSTLPTELARLGRLSSLILRNHAITGTIPSEYGNLTQMQTLSFTSLGLRSTIPSELGRMTAIKILNLEGSFNGMIPDEVMFLPRLEKLQVDSNQITGTLPPAMFENTNLQFIAISGELEGSLPTQIGKLLYLKTLLVSRNELEGTIPTELGQCSSLEVLGMDTNKITGTIPTELGLLSNTLVEISLFKNILHGSIPSEFQQLTRLEFLALELQSGGNCGKVDLKGLGFSSGAAEGGDPPRTNSHIRISSAIFDPVVSCNDGILGTVPSELCSLSSLEALRLTCGNRPYESCPETCCQCVSF